jgi:hypothetical protein
MQRQPYVLVALLCVASLAAGAGGTAAALLAARRQPARPRAAATPGKAPVVTVLGKAEAARLPAGRVVLPEAEAAEFRGSVVCGHCEWAVGELCHKNVLWDRAKRHLLVLLPNDQLDDLQETLTPK